MRKAKQYKPGDDPRVDADSRQFGSKRYTDRKRRIRDQATRSSSAADKRRGQCLSAAEKYRELKSKAPSANPTLWRTCRALANEKRIDILELLCRNRVNGYVVGEIARQMGITKGTASQYLRALNARGLLRAEVIGTSVVYRLSANATMPETRMLVDAFLGEFKKGSECDPARRERIMQDLTAFTFEKRIRLVRALKEKSFATREGFRAELKFKKPTFDFNLDKLLRRGFIVYEKRPEESCPHYRLGAPATPLASALLAIAIG